MAAFPSQRAPLSLPVSHPSGSHCGAAHGFSTVSRRRSPVGSLCVFTSRKLVGAGCGFLFPVSRSPADGGQHKIAGRVCGTNKRLCILI